MADEIRGAVSIGRQTYLKGQEKEFADAVKAANAKTAGAVDLQVLRDKGAIVGFGTKETDASAAAAALVGPSTETAPTTGGTATGSAPSRRTARAPKAAKTAKTAKAAKAAGATPATGGTRGRSR